MEDAKRPACTNGLHDATTDLAQIDAWWAENPNFNLGIVPENNGWAVVDLDPKDQGDVNWAKIEEPKPDTYEVATPSGGRHLYYQGSLPPSASKIAEGVDTRGIGSYVLVPPSVVGGKSYELIKDRDIVPLPEWVGDRVRYTTEKHVAAVDDLDLPGNIDRAKTLLVGLVKQGAIAAEGRGGDAHTYRVACDLLNLGLSIPVAQALFEEHFNPHCLPPWQSDELGVKFENASRYAQNEPGAWAVPPAAEVFGPSLDKIVSEASQQEERRSRFYFEDDEEQDLAPDPVWMINNLLPDRATVLINGKSGDFKSFIAQDIALAIATGIETHGAAPIRIGPTFYGAHEGRNEIKKPRKRAWKAARGVEGRTDFFVAPAPHVALPEQCEEFREQIRVRLRAPDCKKIGAIFLDTVAKCMIGLNENDARDCGIFIAFVDSLRDEFECPVICLHHFGKDEGRGGRGSSALPAGFDTIIHVKRAPGTKLVKVWVSQHKDADEPRDPWCFEGRTVGASLAFFPVTLEEYDTLAGDTDTLSGRKIGTALKELNAFGQENAVTSFVLASHLTPVVEGEATDAHQGRVQVVARGLAPLAKSKLEAYAYRDGRDVRWCLPAPDA